MPVIAKLASAGYDILATKGTAQALKDYGVCATLINKLGNQKPTIMDLILKQGYKYYNKYSRKNRIFSF
jgi:carbamoyl-phosphate synthase large subunit